ncbi:MAG: MBL fold metallo-hydrolase [Synergistaceae bacterium]|jgi:glyoxylase-like metal-dependent hydrolase (beta-lactamase superfamily II)|nr:MBL fold metallo-hydrolase [Synergistaceae bacterium]
MNPDKSDAPFPDLPEGLHLLDLPQPKRGFQQFIAAWFFVDDQGRRILIDPGPADTIPLLAEQLSKITDGVDYVLLTHIHLDHSGGLGQFCNLFKAKVLVHPKGRKHLLNPEKLWKASLDTLGDIAAMYGAPLPTPPDALLESPALSGVTVLETPGHAPHHLSFIISFRKERLFFTGEAAGLFLPVRQESGLPYLRPTTPPKFDGDAARTSLTETNCHLRDDDWFCYSHWGALRKARRMVELAQEQIEQWIAVTGRLRDRSEEEITEYLLQNDPLLGGFTHLPEDLRERERLFIRNSVMGVRGYLNSGGPQTRP